MKDWGRKFIESGTMNAFKATFTESEGVKYVFFDFDDTVRESVNYGDDSGPPVEIGQVRVFPGMGKAIQQWIKNGYKVVGATNQKGSLRRREFVPAEQRASATLEDAAQGCGAIIQETLDQLGVSFPVLFTSDSTVFIYNGGSVSVGGTFGTEDKKGGKAPKPSPAMGQVAFKLFGTPDLENSLMVGDSFENGDEMFANAIGVKWIHPGKLGRDFIEFTNQKFSEEMEEESGTILQPNFYNTHGY